jgi:hypothetical protein
MNAKTTRRHHRPEQRLDRLSTAARATLEQLETRRLLCGLSHDLLIAPPTWSDAIEAEYAAAAGPEGPDSTSIVWTNRGQASDGFSAAFGTSAAGMRNIVDAALEHWERIFTDWNRSDNTTTLQLTVSISGTGFGGAAAPDSTAPADGKPRTGGITLGSGNNDGNPNSSNGWYLDPNPDDHAEFSGTIVNAFAGNATGLGNDFYSVVVAEAAHVLGLISDKFNNGADWDGYLLESSGFLTDTNVSDTAEGNGNGEFWVFEGPTIDHLMTTFNSGDANPTSWGNIVHTSGPGPLGGLFFNNKTWFGSDDAGNAFYNTSQRTLPSFVTTHVLADAYDYDFIEPDTFGTFYALLNESTGALTIRGGALISDDVFTITFTGTDYIVSIDAEIEAPGTGAFSGTQDLPAWVSTFSAAEVSSIVIEAGAGDDDIFINGAEAPVTVNAGSGDDFISVGGGDIDSNLDANVSVLGDDGTDIIWMDDTNDGLGGDDYYLTVNRLEKNNDSRRVYYETIESLFLLGSDQNSSYHVAFLPAGITASVTAGSGDDSFTVANGDIEDNLDSNVAVHGGGGDDALVINDTTDGVNADTYELSEFQLTKAPAGANRTIEFSGMQSLVIDGSNQNSTWNVLSVNSGMPVTLNGGTGNETFNVAEDDLDSDIDSNMTINGGDGDDTINFDDSGDAAGNDNYTVGQLTFSKDVRDFRYNGIEAINLTGSPQADTFTLNGSPGNTLITLESGQGNDTFNLGNGDLGTVLTGFVLRGQGGTDAVNINDVNDTEDDTYTLTSSTFSKTFINGNTRQFLDYAGMESLVLDANFEDNTINIQSTHADTPVTVRGGDGNDTYHIGLADSVGDIDASVQASGGNGNDALFYNDAASLADFAYTVEPNNLNRDNVANVQPSVENITVNAGSGSNVITAGSNNANTTINGGAGDDTFLVATGLWDTGIQGPVTVNGDGGTDGLFINDSNDTGADNYNLTATQATKNAAFAAPIGYGTIESLQLDANGDANIIQVTNTFDGDVTLRGRGGADQFNIIETFPGRAVIVQGGGDLDQVAVNANGVGAAAVQFTTTQQLASLTIGSGGSATLVANGNRVLLTQALSMTGTAVLDLADNYAIFDYPAGGPSPLDNVRALLTSGYAGGAWNGAGINSSVAATTGNTAIGYAEATDLFTTFPVTFAGLSVDDTSMLLAHTVYGDANLNRTVNLQDFNRLAANFGLSVGARWSQGNFDFNTNVNLQDFNRLAANFGGGAAPMLPAAGGLTNDPSQDDEKGETQEELPGEIA